jgi:hypothetical protein
MFHEKNNPALAARVTLMRATLEKIRRDGPLIYREVERAVGAPPAKVRGISEANEAAVAALVIDRAS